MGQSCPLPRPVQYYTMQLLVSVLDYDASWLTLDSVLFSPLMTLLSLSSLMVSLQWVPCYVISDLWFSLMVCVRLLSFPKLKKRFGFMENLKQTPRTPPVLAGKKNHLVKVCWMSFASQRDIHICLIKAICVARQPDNMNDNILYRFLCTIP